MTSLQEKDSSGPRFDVAAVSRTGVGPLARTENQDNFLIIDAHGMASFLRGQQHCTQRVPAWIQGHTRVAVLDGMGGHGHGREAAEAVVAGLLEIPPCATVAELAERLDVLHARLQHEFATDGLPDRRPGTTLTMLDIPAQGPALLYHVGDSRLYKIAGGKVDVLTVDHVPATAFAMEGLLSEREWWLQVHGEHRPQIAQAFILGNAFDDPTMLSDPLHALSSLNLPAFLSHLPDRRPLTLDTDAVYLLASDGFWSCADPLAMVARWPSLLAGKANAQEMAEALFAAMEDAEPGFLHPDNLTAIVIKWQHVIPTRK